MTDESARPFWKHPGVVGPVLAASSRGFSPSALPSMSPRNRLGSLLPVSPRRPSIA